MIFRLDLPEEHQLVSNHIYSMRYTKENTGHRGSVPLCRKGLFWRSQSNCSSVISAEFQFLFPIEGSMWRYITYNSILSTKHHKRPRNQLSTFIHYTYKLIQSKGINMYWALSINQQASHSEEILKRSQYYVSPQKSHRKVTASALCLCPTMTHVAG